MTLDQIKEKCSQGKVGMIPGWTGYIKYDYYKKQIYFVNGDYVMNQSELEHKISNRTDLLYII